MTLVWLAGIIAALSVFVFPPEERFIETMAISAGCLMVLVLPIYVRQNLTAIEPQAIGLGAGLRGMIGAYLVAAVLPWLQSPLVEPAETGPGYRLAKMALRRSRGPLDSGLTVFPLAYAITTSKYAFRSGKIAKDIGWGNYRKLFNDVLFRSRHPQ